MVRCWVAEERWWIYTPAWLSRMSPTVPSEGATMLSADGLCTITRSTGEPSAATTSLRPGKPLDQAVACPRSNTKWLAVTGPKGNSGRQGLASCSWLVCPSLESEKVSNIAIVLCERSWIAGTTGFGAGSGEVICLRLGPAERGLEQRRGRGLAGAREEPRGGGVRRRRMAGGVNPEHGVVETTRARGGVAAQRGTGAGCKVSVGRVGVRDGPANVGVAVRGRCPAPEREGPGVGDAV